MRRYRPFVRSVHHENHRRHVLHHLHPQFPGVPLLACLVTTTYFSKEIKPPRSSWTSSSPWRPLESTTLTTWGGVDLEGMFFGAKGEGSHRRTKSKGMTAAVNRILGAMWDVCWDTICLIRPSIIYLPQTERRSRSSELWRWDSPLSYRWFTHPKYRDVKSVYRLRRIWNDLCCSN